jgi:hypothetical protein
MPSSLNHYGVEQPSKSSQHTNESILSLSHVGYAQRFNVWTMKLLLRSDNFWPKPK